MKKRVMVLMVIVGLLVLTTGQAWAGPNDQIRPTAAKTGMR